MTLEKPKLMSFPRHVLIGHHALAQIGDVVADLGFGPRALLVVDERTKKIAGDDVARFLRKAGHATEFSQIHGATMKSVAEVKKAAKDTKAAYLIGAGGGSVIDVAKLAAFELGMPYISLPTSAAHDGIASSRASIKETQGNVSKEARAPEAIIADTDIITKAPYRMIAAGCGDVLANLVAVKDWELAARLRGEEFSSFAAVVSRTSAELILENAASIKPGLEESARIVVKSLVASGWAMSIAGSSRPASGSEHMFSHMLDRLAPTPALHGEQCGVGAILMMHLHHGNWQEIRDALATIGAPTTARQLGIAPKILLTALTKAHSLRLDRYTILGESGLTMEAATHLAKETGVL